jgi:hypothetical protein
MRKLTYFKEVIEAESSQKGEKTEEPKKVEEQL